MIRVEVVDGKLLRVRPGRTVEFLSDGSLILDLDEARQLRNRLNASISQVVKHNPGLASRSNRSADRA